MERSVIGTPRPANVAAAVPIGAGVVCALVGFTSAFAVVLAGLRAVGATPGQAASGLLAVTVTMGASTVLLSWRYRMPITVAWSTPGAALLVSTGAVAGGWPAAVGAFVVCGAFLVLTGLWPALASLVQRIPAPIAQAMLAGVLLPLCLAPVSALSTHPVAVAPVLVVWLVLLKVRPRWAVPAAFVTALAVIGVSLVRSSSVPAVSAMLPHLEWTTPAWSLQALTGVALPLYIVTMASQNIPGVAVMSTYGYTVPWRPALTVTGVGSVLGAPLGGHAINLAAISAALAAGPDAGDDRSRRWIAGVSAGLGYLVLGVLSTGLTAAVLAAPGGVVQAVAGVALVGAFAAACAGAMADDDARVPAAVTFIVAASGTTVAGIGSAFWALVVGIAVYWVLGVRRPEGTV
ncbi:benzoate/H(+) symporter BenE family transporter [Tsukamurella paurometabola]|uniref:Benzoate transporter n=1 Tax=Tsukamurella paurometabola (strain ATCC 8368 / DSM 20162 / CCUG 35730 / CIP 100753 / JCM 10117 / KCTC 9821 / NBRC 16120 / NCIMB 702349 / NCTC 13040) TaxID=521096 RepID=D5UXI9_TSUPD|nr:benzoate/H(+) symporter BenE family transporter [Tsukamurella paurometabola]ADG78081.1 benzoate transporter [Tsukamurella paurometabola DSM 20162]